MVFKVGRPSSFVHTPAFYQDLSHAIVKCSTARTIIPLGLLAVACSEKKRPRLRKSLRVGYVACFRRASTGSGASSRVGRPLPGWTGQEVHPQQQALLSNDTAQSVSSRRGLVACMYTAVTELFFLMILFHPIWGTGIALMSSPLPTATPFTT